MGTELCLLAVILLAGLAVLDLMVGVSNDAVNFLNSSLGSRVAPRYVILSIASLGILAVTAVYKWTRREAKNKNLYLSVDWQLAADENPEGYLEQLSTIVSRHAISSDLRRFDIREKLIELTYFLDVASTDNLSALADELRREFPAIGVTFLDQNQLPSL